MSLGNHLIDRASVAIQWTLWEMGISWHNTIRDECTPDFSCCIHKYAVGSEERFILGQIANSLAHGEVIVTFNKSPDATEAGNREGANA